MKKLTGLLWSRKMDGLTLEQYGGAIKDSACLMHEFCICIVRKSIWER